MKKAKLVYMTMVTRVVVDENATEDEIIEASRPKFAEKVHNDLWENVELVKDDTECPYGTCE